MKELFLVVAFEVLGAISCDEGAYLKKIDNNSLVIALVLLVASSLVVKKVGNLVLEDLLLDLLEDVHNLVVALSEFIECPVIDDLREITSFLGVQEDGVDDVVTHGCSGRTGRNIFFAIELNG